MYIIQLPQVEQDEIRRTLESLGLDKDEIEIAMNSKVTDLEEVIR